MLFTVLKEIEFLMCKQLRIFVVDRRQQHNHLKLYSKVEDLSINKSTDTHVLSYQSTKRLHRIYYQS